MGGRVVGCEDGISFRFFCPSSVRVLTAVACLISPLRLAIKERVARQRIKQALELA